MTTGGRVFNAGRSDLTPLPWSKTAATPDLVVCPVSPMTASGAYPPAVHEIYRLAYERALAAARPSFYDLASRISSN